MSNVSVYNQSPPTITIGPIDFSGVTVVCDTFCPCNPSENGTLTISDIGQSTLDITYSPFGVPPYLNGCIEVTDSLGNIQNFNVGTGTSGIASFSNVTYDGVTDIQITVYDNLCNPIVTPSPTPTPTNDPLPTPTASVTPLPTNWTQLPTATPTFTPTQTQTPSVTPISTYTYLGKTNPDSADSATACSTYVTIRGYVSLKSSSGPQIKSIEPPPTLLSNISASLPIAFSVGKILCSKEPSFQSLMWLTAPSNAAKSASFIFFNIKRSSKIQ